MGVYVQDHKIGYTHHRFIPEDDGYRFTQESLLRMTVLKTEQTVHVAIEGKTGSDYALKSFEASLKSGVGSFAAEGVVEGDELVLTVETAGDRSSQRLRLDGPIYLPTGERRWLMQSGLRPGRQVTLQIFDPSTMGYQPMSSTVEAREALEIHGARREAWRIREDFRAMTTRVWIDDAGVVLREEGPLGMVALKETPEQALTVGWKGDGAFDLMAVVAVPVVKKIPRARNLQHLELHVGGIPASAVPRDGRQDFTDGRLIIERESLDSGGTFKLPYRAERWRAELAATPFVQVDHPRVRAAATEAVGGETDARRAAEAILEWVFRRLEKVPTASIPNALQVLQMGVGDCNEHAVLFAALARAAGLPARVVAGAVYSEGVFLYHAWDEVWLGSGWVSVDPTFDQMPADATHIKFIEGGPDVHDGILRIIGRLSLEVVAAR